MAKPLLDRLLVFLASLYVSRHLEHHCHGEHCHVCHHIHRCLELISFCLKLVIAPLVLVLRRIFFRPVRINFFVTYPTTLVSQKVLLLN